MTKSSYLRSARSFPILICRSVIVSKMVTTFPVIIVYSVAPHMCVNKVTKHSNVVSGTDSMFPIPARLTQLQCSEWIYALKTPDRPRYNRVSGKNGVGCGSVSAGSNCIRATMHQRHAETCITNPIVNLYDPSKDKKERKRSEALP